MLRGVTATNIMSEFFICGKPRGGKTYLGVKWIYETLLQGKDLRPIVTNIKLNKEEIAEELKKDLKLDYRPDLTDRIRILDDGETGEFWLYAVGREFMKRRSIKMRNFSFNVPDFEDRGKEGCLYVIDEVHVYFPSAFGSKIDNEDDLRFFLTQHGKMQIDIIFITQHPEQTSKVLRRLAQEYMSVRNLSREPYLGFRVGNLFRFVRSLNSPGSANPAVFESGFVGMDFEKFGKMYDTTAGVGIVGTIVKEPAKRGRSLYWLLLPLGTLLVLFYCAHKYAPSAIVRLAKSAGAGGEKMAGPQIRIPTNNLTPTSLAAYMTGRVLRKPLDSVSASITNTATDTDDTAQTEEKVTGFAVVGGVRYVTLSDGVTYSGSDIEWVSNRLAKIQGQVFRFNNWKDYEKLEKTVIDDSLLNSYNKDSKDSLNKQTFRFER